MRPVTGGRRALQLGTPGGLPPKGRDESCRTAYGELPGPDPGRLRRPTLAAHSSGSTASTVHGSRPGRQARRAEGAPLNVREENPHNYGVVAADSATGDYSVQSN
jgi:hypothetical protein